MRKVELNMTEEFKYNTIKRLVETNGNKNSAALKLGCTRRTINRMIKGYQEHGKPFFQHSNTGRKPVNAIDTTTAQQILTLYDNICWPPYIFSFSHINLVCSITTSTARAVLSGGYP